MQGSDIDMDVCEETQQYLIHRCIYESFAHVVVAFIQFDIVNDICEAKVY